MATIGYNLQIVGAGISISSNINRTADGLIAVEPTVNTAKALSSWAKSDANTAAGNLAGGHGWSSGKCDVYWTGGRRYDVDAVITIDAVALDNGSGDDYPANGNTTVTMAMHQQVNQVIDGDLLELLAIVFESATASSTARGHVHAEDVDGDVIADLDFDANEARVWDIDAGQTNTFTGDIIRTLYVTMDSATETVKCKIVGCQDVTP